MFETANYIEAGLWMTLGFGFIFYGLLRKTLPTRKWLLISLTLVLFGISDIIEIRTGAWWRPWWLLVWKSLCVLVLAVCVIQHYSQRSNNELEKQTN